jgi:hypothetical protein
VAGSDELHKLEARIAALEHELAELKRGTRTVRPLTRKKNEEEMMKADRLLSRTFGPVGRVSRHGEHAQIPPTRPMRVVFLKAGHRHPNPHPPKIEHARVTKEHRAVAKPASASKIPLKR